jgi:hypothetical protein
VLYDALLHLGYNGDVPVYRSHMSIAHGLDRCEVSVMIPLNPSEPWIRTVIGIELDDIIEQMAHVALTSLCESCFTATAAMPIALFPIHNQGDPVWKQRLEAVSDPECPHFHVGMAEYEQYSFNLQHNLTRTVIQQRLSMAAFDEHHIAIPHELEQLKHENALLHGGTLPPLDQERELNVTYRRLSEDEHG